MPTFVTEGVFSDSSRFAFSPSQRLRESYEHVRKVCNYGNETEQKSEQRKTSWLVSFFLQFYGLEGVTFFKNLRLKH